VSLQLHENYLNGTIPESVINLNRLVYLYLHNNKLTGTIPESVGNINKLEYLSLSQNELTGAIHDGIGNLNKLVYLYLRKNKLTGTIPESVENLTELVYLYLHENKLTGTIPESVGNLPELVSLQLHENYLNGTIPESVINLNRLVYLYLHNNKLTGTIPESVGNINKLEYLSLSQNELTGAIHDGIGNLNKLVYLYLRKNKLTGTIPESVGNLPELEILWLDENNLTGTIPESVGNLTELVEVQLNGNKLSGTIPESVGNLINLEKFNLGSNALTGTVPNIYGKLPNFKEIDLSDNNFEGILPPNIFGGVSIEKINLSGNKFHGNLNQYSDTKKLRFLKELILGNNCLFGELPSDLMDTMPKLSMLDLSHNNSNCENKMFNREYCEWSVYDYNDFLCCNESNEPDEIICSKDYLYGWDNIIILHQTGLWGHLPPEYAKFTFMEELDLSGNSLGGTIPLEYVQFGRQKVNIKLDGNTDLTGLAALDICRQARHVIDVTQQEDVCPAERNAVVDVFEDLDLNEKYWWTENNADNDYNYNPSDSACNWNYITCVDGKVQSITLTSMALSGSISPSIGTLTYLEVLNLRDNQIVGTIPLEIGDLNKLRELIIAHNRIQKEIPEELKSLKNLEVFQVHANRLKGKVPDEIKVNETKFNFSSFTADCGYPSFFPDSLKCERCTICCNSKEECTRMDNHHNTTNYSIVVSVFILIFIISLPKIGSFLKLVQTDLVVIDDVMKKIGTNSVYIFCLSEDWILNLLAAILVIIQLSAFNFFFSASKFKADVDSDWRYTYECPMDELLCTQDISRKYGPMLITMFIIIIFTGRDFLAGSWIIIFCSRLQNGVKKFRILVVGAVLILISFFSLLISIYYIFITTTKTTEVLVSSVLILFINTLDEEVFGLIEKLYPDTMGNEIESIKLLYADIIENNQHNSEEHEFLIPEEEEINATVEIEHEEEIYQPPSPLILL